MSTWRPYQSSTPSATVLQSKDNSSQLNILANRQPRAAEGIVLAPYKLHAGNEEERAKEDSKTQTTSSQLPGPRLHDSRASSLTNDSGTGLRLQLSKSNSKLVFNTQIDQLYSERFYAIQAPIEMLLGRYASKKPFIKSAMRQKPMAIRLITLGDKADNAKPHIVVFCAPELRKRLQYFFDTDKLVQAFSKPDDASLPAFDVVVCGCEPKLRNDTTASVVWETVADMLLGDYIETRFQGTYCGTPIQFHANGKCRNATVGGVVKLIDKDGNLSIWGLTAGHAARACLVDYDSVFDHATEACSDMEDDHSFLDDSESEDGITEDENASDLATALEEATQLNEDNDYVPWDFKRPKSFGDAVISSVQSSEKGSPPKGYFDWALVPIPGASGNVLPEHTSWGTTSSIERICMEPPSQNLTDKSIFLIRAGGGLKWGRLLPQPSRIRISPGDDFVDVYVVTLDGPDAFVDGDSGAWVILQDTHELLGYVVATDCFGAAYVMAACHVFIDIERSQQAIEVSLPTLADVVAIVAEQSLRQQCASNVADDSSALLSADRFTTRTSKANSHAPSIPKSRPFSNTTSITLDNIPVSTLAVFGARLSEMDGYVSSTSESEEKTCLIIAEFDNYWTASSAIHKTTLLAQSKRISKFAASFSRARKLREEAGPMSRTSDGRNSGDSTVAKQGALPCRSVIVEGPKYRSTSKQVLPALYALDNDEKQNRKFTHDTTLAKQTEDEDESDIGLSYKLYQRTY